MNQSNQSDTLLDVLSKTERLPKQLLEAYQNRSLKIMLQHAYENTDFYRDRLACLFDKNGDIDLEALKTVPILTRPEIQATPERLYADEVPFNSGGKIDSFTSGSTGEPLKMRYSSINGLIARAIHRRTYVWNDIDFDLNLAEISSRPHQSTDGRWNSWGSGKHFVLSLRTSSIEDQLLWLARLDVSYLRGFPTVCSMLLQEADRRNIQLNLKNVFTIGEMIPDTMRREKPKHWPEVVDIYGTTETGTICSQCKFGSYHVHIENVFLEILDDDGNPVAPGEIGRVVITSLYNFAMPFIRYAIGDFAVQGEGQCPCGVTLPIVERIVGRERNYFRFPGGHDVWPFAQSSQIMKYIPNRFRQIAQISDYGIEFRYTPVTDDQPEDPDGLKRYLSECLHPDIELTIVRVPIPVRTQGQKHLEYVCELT